MPQLQQIISRIQSGELTRENDTRGSNGFWDYLYADMYDFATDGYFCFNALWGLYETMTPKEKECENTTSAKPMLKKEYRWNKITGELLGTFYCDKPMGDYETNVKPVKPIITTTEKTKLDELEERVERLEKAVGIEHFYSTNQ